MADAQLVGVRHLQKIAAVGEHHPPDFGNDDAQEFFEFDARGQIARKAFNNRLARFVHFDFAFERKFGGGIKFEFHMRKNYSAMQNLFSRRRR